MKAIENICDKELKYHVTYYYMIEMNGEPDRFTNFMHAYNTWLFYFNVSYGEGIADWAKDWLLWGDIDNTTRLLIQLFNGPEDNITPEMQAFIDGLRPCENFEWTRNYVYPSPMTFYDDSCEKYGYHAKRLFRKIMKLVGHYSMTEYAREEFKKAGLPYTIINVT